MSKRKTPTKFREGQFIVITAPSNLYAIKITPVIGSIYRQDALDYNIYCRGIRYSGYSRDSKINWRFATTEEVSLYVSNRGPVKGLGLKSNKKYIDNYSII